MTLFPTSGHFGPLVVDYDVPFTVVISIKPSFSALFLPFSNFTPRLGRIPLGVGPSDGHSNLTYSGLNPGHRVDEGGTSFFAYRNS